MEAPTISWPFAPENTFVAELEGLYVPWEPEPVAEPALLALNEELAAELGLDADLLRSADGLAVLAGNAVPEGTTPVAQAYAGHQFGGYSPRLGDGRALLLGEVVDRHGRRRDLHLKGSGRTPFARGGDGRAAVGPMLRELVIGEAMHGLGIPTTRALAVVATGQPVRRESLLPGAVLTRVAASHLRVGTFQFAASTGDHDLLQRLVDHAVARHHPEAAGHRRPALGLFEAVVAAQASLVARWMLVGFIHGVMNTDNTTISGETIDYGPCAFMDAYDPATVYSSIDHGGRYAYGNQPAITSWNLARLAETLLPLIDEDQDAAVAGATEVLQRFPELLAQVHEPGMRAKVGLDPAGERPGDAELVVDLLDLLQQHRVDMTSAFRSLSAAARGDDAPFRRLFAPTGGVAPSLIAPAGVASSPGSSGRAGSPPGSSGRVAPGAVDLTAPPAVDRWLERWTARLATGPAPEDVAAAMDAVNPVYTPRNHLVEEALAAATGGDMAPVERLLEVVADPFTERPGLERYAEPAPAGFGDTYQTFCGT